MLEERIVYVYAFICIKVQKLLRYPSYLLAFDVLHWAIIIVPTIKVVVDHGKDNQATEHEA
jgi:hypothetical protein